MGMISDQEDPFIRQLYLRENAQVCAAVRCNERLHVPVQRCGRILCRKLCGDDGTGGCQPDHAGTEYSRNRSGSKEMVTVLNRPLQRRSHAEIGHT